MVAFVTTVGIALSVVDVDKYSALEVVCHLINGWSILFALPQLLEYSGRTGVFYMALGGVMYTIGAALYGIGSKMRFMHCVFTKFFYGSCFYK